MFIVYARRPEGKLHAALQYLQTALKIEAKLPNVQNLADTHINAWAVLSQLGRHQTDLEHAQSLTERVITNEWSTYFTYQFVVYHIYIGYQFVCLSSSWN